MSYQSNNNVVLFDNCTPLDELSVLLEVVEDITTTDGSGYSLQLNCFPVAGHYAQHQQLTFLQYIVCVTSEKLWWQVQYWANGASTWPQGYVPIPNTSPWLPGWPTDYQLIEFGSAPGNVLPRQSTLQISLSTDDDDNVTSVDFQYTDPNLEVASASFQIPQLALCPITACTVDLVGPGNSANCTFNDGLTHTRGLLYYTVGSGTLSVQSGGGGSACGEQGIGTAETSNATYSDITDAPNTTVMQTVAAGVPCGVTGLFGKEDTTLGQMRIVRDRQLDSPAGAFVREVLERHSADLLGLLGEHPELAELSRDLLRDTLHVATAGSLFSDDLIDRARLLIDRAAPLLPPSMAGTDHALRTVLEALRRRSIDDGLALASQNVTPRFPPPHSRPPHSRKDQG